MSPAPDPRASYRADRTLPHRRFDDVETTMSHLFRAPHPALDGRTYGEALYDALEEGGWLRAVGNVVELGGGLGDVAHALTSRAAARGRPLRYTFVELSPRLLRVQRERVPDASTVAAEAQHLPFRTGSLEGLFVANEVIADLPVGEAPPRFGTAGSNVNVGALLLLEELARVLAPGAAAFLSEFGGAEAPAPVALHGPLGEGRHVEHSIDFAALERAAQALGFETVCGPLAPWLRMDGSVRVASYHDVLRLRRLVPRLPVLAHPREVLERRHPVLTRLFALEFPRLDAPTFPHPGNVGGGLFQRFQTLILRKPR